MAKHKKVKVDRSNKLINWSIVIDRRRPDIPGGCSTRLIHGGQTVDLEMTKAQRFELAMMYCPEIIDLKKAEAFGAQDQEG